MAAAGMVLNIIAIASIIGGYVVSEIAASPAFLLVSVAGIVAAAIGSLMFVAGQQKA